MIKQVERTTLMHTTTHRRPSRLRLIAGALLPAILLVGCATTQDAEPATGPPEAPQQLMPPAADEHQSTEGVPIAELASADWVEDTAAEHAIPRRAMAAYTGAALRMAETHPECNMGWNTLAGVGAIESSHASIGGAGLDAAGVAQPNIIGPVLDGSEGVMAIEDTEDGVLDGDDEWDRAVGPMQFLPETWQRYAVDANQDGQTDPQQIDDAVLTAAVYLCDNTEDLTNDSMWVTAITTYNQSMAYARDVAATAASFEPPEHAS